MGVEVGCRLELIECVATCRRIQKAHSNSNSPWGFDDGPKCCTLYWIALVSHNYSRLCTEGQHKIVRTITPPSVGGKKFPPLFFLLFLNITTVQIVLWWFVFYQLCIPLACSAFIVDLAKVIYLMCNLFLQVLEARIGFEYSAAGQGTPQPHKNYRAPIPVQQ